MKHTGDKMVNAYLLVEISYKEDPELEYILPLKLVTSFLREQAWSGADRQELQLIWKNIYAYMLASVNNDLEPFVINDKNALRIILKWLRDCAVDFLFTEQSAKKLLEDIKNLHVFLNANQFQVTAMETIEKFLKTLYTPEGLLNLQTPPSKSKVMHLDFGNRALATDQKNVVIYLREHIAELVPKTLNILKTNAYRDWADKSFMYYQYFWELYLQQEEDFGSDKIVPDIYSLPNKEVDPYCMLSFVEYLLFEVHFPKVKQQLLDKLISLSNKLPGFQAFLEFYRDSQFTLFRVCSTNSYVGTTVQNIFNEQKIILPNIFLNYEENRGRIFFAYFNPNKQLLPSTILSVGVTENQKKMFVRLVKNLYKFLARSQPLSFEDFFKTQGLFIRYLLVNTNSSKFVLEKFASYLGRQESFNYSNLLLKELKATERELIKLGRNLNFSQEDLDKLTCLWRNFCNLSSFELNMLEYFKFAVLLCYCELIYPGRIVQKIREIFALEEKILQKCISQVKNTLNLEINNLQYLTEYGKIQLLIRLKNKE